MSTTVGRTIAIRGEIRSGEDLTIEGRVDGPIFCERSAVVVAASARIAGDIIADDITVYGSVTGQLVATDIVDVRPGATVRGQVMSKRFILDPEAAFTGRVEPQHLQAALSVARFNQKKRDGAATA
jgi:cytoskeletal protein CcmA (bactofilin family)